MSRRAHRYLLVCLSLCWMCAPIQAAEKKPPTKDLSELRARIDHLKQEIDDAEEDKADVLDGLKQSERAISEINRDLHDLMEQRQEISDTLSLAEQQSKRTRARIAQQQTLLARLLYQQYVNGSQDTMRLLLNLENPNEIGRQMTYYGYLSRSRASVIAGLRQDLAQAEAAEAVVRDKHGELAQVAQQQLTQKRALQAEADAHKRALKRLERQIGDRRKQVTKLERDERRLTQLVQRLARAARPVAGKTRRPGSLAAGASSDGAQRKGKPRLPVAGELRNRFGERRSDTGIAWKGLFIRAGAGSAVKALGAGQVVFADWLRGFGNLIIVDHGDGYMSLYGNNETLLKREGDEVASGDDIAQVGNSGGNAETGLYFEVRYQSRAIDPMLWLGKH